MPYALPDAAHTLGQTAATQSAALARSANFKPNQLLLCAAGKAVSAMGKKGVQREKERGRKRGEAQRLVSEAAADAAAGVAGLQLLRPLGSESFINLAYDKLCLGQQLEPKSTDNCAASAIPLPLSPYLLLAAASLSWPEAKAECDSDT